MAKLPAADRDAFLAGRRYGVLSTLDARGAPVSVPVWYEWDGASARMFTHARSAKMARLARDQRASLLVANHPDEKETWVLLEGRITVREEGGLELAERLLPRYYLEGDPRRAALDEWRRMEADWRLLELSPEKIRSYRD